MASHGFRFLSSESFNLHQGERDDTNSRPYHQWPYDQAPAHLALGDKHSYGELQRKSISQPTHANNPSNITFVAQSHRTHPFSNNVDYLTNVPPAYAKSLKRPITANNITQLISHAPDSNSTDHRDRCALENFHHDHAQFERLATPSNGLRSVWEALVLSWDALRGRIQHETGVLVNTFTVEELDEVYHELARGSPAVSTDNLYTFSIERMAATMGALIHRKFGMLAQLGYIYPHQSQRYLADLVPFPDNIEPHVRLWVYNNNVLAQEWDEAHFEGIQEAASHRNQPDSCFGIKRGPHNQINDADGTHQSQTPVAFHPTSSAMSSHSLSTATVINEDQSLFSATATSNSVSDTSTHPDGSNVSRSQKRGRRTRIRSTTRAGNTRWTAHDLQQAQQMYAENKSIPEIAQALHRSENSVGGKLWRARGNDPHRSDKRYRDANEAAQNPF